MQDALIITGISGAEHCAASLSKQLCLAVEVAGSRKDGLAALRRHEFSIVVIDEPMAEASPEGGDLLWKQLGVAIPLQINFGILGTNRLIREVRAAMQRRELEKALAMRVATSTLENELRDTVAGLLLQSQLALTESQVSPSLAKRLQMMAALASSLRARLDLTVPQL